MKITISGVVGAGKTTLAGALTEKLNLEYRSIGKIMRDMAIDRGISFDELTVRAKTDKSIDLELDEKQKNMDRDDGFIMDSRLGFYFVPSSVKIYLKVDMDEAARRIFAMNRDDQHYESFKECFDACEARVEAEKVRYKNVYNLEFGDLSFFDLVIDTTGKEIQDIVLEVENFIRTLKEI